MYEETFRQRLLLAVFQFKTVNYTKWLNRVTYHGEGTDWRNLCLYTYTCTRARAHSHTHTHTHTHTCYDSERAISPLQRPLPAHHTTRDEHPCPQQDSNPEIQAIKRLQTYAIDSTLTWIGRSAIKFVLLFHCLFLQVGTYLDFFQSLLLSSSFHILASWEPVLVRANLWQGLKEMPGTVIACSNIMLRS